MELVITSEGLQSRQVVKLEHRRAKPNQTKMQTVSRNLVVGRTLRERRNLWFKIGAGVHYILHQSGVKHTCMISAPDLRRILKELRSVAMKF